MKDESGKRFFITHAHADNAFAQRFADDLRRLGLDGFFDIYSIRPGDNIPANINKGLAECDIYVPILSNAALDSTWCEEEITAALTLANRRDRHGRPRIIPVLIEDCKSRISQQYPTLLTRLHVSFIGRYDEALQELLTRGFSLPLGDDTSDKNGKYGIYLKKIFDWVAKNILVVGIILLFIFVLYALTFIEIIPDCCGFIPTKTPTATLTATPSQTPKITDMPALIFSSTFTPTHTPSPTKTNTFTPSPTPTITFTPTQTPNPIIFKGFDRNCIDSDYWTPHVYPGEATPEPNGCLDLSTRGFNSQDGGLRISINNVPYSVFSISTELPNKDSEIHFKINFDAFTSRSSDTAAVLVFGVGPSDDWIMKNGYYLSYSILQGSTTNEILEQTGVNKLKPEHLLHKFFSPKKNIDVRMVIKGIEVTMYIDNATYGFFPISLSKQGSRDNFWIGYQLPANQSTLKATISEFTIVETK